MMSGDKDFKFGR